MVAIDLSVEAGFPYKGIATLLSVLAWPEEIDNLPRMQTRHAHVSQTLLTIMANVDPKWANETQGIKPAHFLSIRMP